MFPGWQQWGQNMTGVNPAMANVQPQMQIGSFPQQMYWGYQQPQHQQWPGTQPPMASAGGAPGLLGFGPPGQQLNIQPGQQGIPGYGGMTPAPPVEPPKEEKPPLPPEPQAPEPPPPPAPEGEENLGPKDSREAEKLTNLQQQAQQWQKQKQWEEYTQSWYSYQQQMQQYMQNHTMDDILKEEQEFNQQYKDWKQQYEDWKEQNKNHPNQEQYQQYANQWKEYEQQMEEKRQEIGQRKEYFEQHQGAQKGEPGMQPGQVPPGQGQFNQGPPQGDGQGPPPTPNQLQNQGRFPGPGNERFTGPRPQEGRGLGPRGPCFDGPRGRGNRFGGPGNRFEGPRGRGRGQDQTRFGPPQQQGGPRFQAPQQGQQQRFPPSGQQQRFQSPNEQQNSDANFDDQMDIEDENETQNDVNQSGLGQFQHSQGPQDQHMFRGPGQQGPRGPRGPGMQGPRGPAGPRGPQQQRPRGPSQLGPRGPVQQGPRGAIKQGPRGPNQEGPRGPRDPTQQSQRGPRPRGPGQQMSTRPGAPGPRGRFEMGNKGPRFSAPGGPRFQNANQISASPAETQNTKGAAQQAPSGVVSLLDLTFDESKMKALNKKNVGSEQQNLSEGGQPQRSGPPGRGPGDNQQNRAPQGGQGNTQTGTVQQRPNQNQKNLNQSDSQGQNENKSEMTKSKDSTVKNGSGGANPVAATGVEVPKLSLSEEQHALIRKAAEEIQLKGLSGITTFVGGASAQDDAHSSDLADLPYAGDRNITEKGFGASYRYDDVPGRYEDERHGYLPPRDLPEDIYRRPPGRDPYEDDLYGRPRLPPPPHDPLFDDLRRDPYDRRGPLYDPLGPPRGREFDRLLPPPPTRDRLLYDEYRYRDPYRYSPLPRPPPTRGYGYLPAPPPLPPLAPRSAPEVIDYGHQGSVMKEKEKEIIDYGHGSGSGSSTAVDDYFSKELIRERDDPYYNRPLDDRLSRDIDRGRPRERSRSRERDWDRLRDRDRERDRGRERSRERDRSRERERIRDIDRGRDIDRSRDRDRYTRDRHAASLRPPRDPYPAPGERSTSYGHHSSPVPHSVRDEPKPETVNIIDILYNPGRKTRPANIVIILRGLPGSGKTYISKLIRDKETAHGGHAPRLLNLDDYFMVEVEKTEKDPETGKRVKVKVMEYEYEPELEESYRQSLLKSFKKTIDDGFFPFIIVDAVNDRIRYFEEFWSYAKSKGFQVYIARIEGDVATCAKRNTYNRTQKEIQKLLDRWEKTPSHFLRLDVRPLLQEGSIQEVEMEDFSEETTRSDVASQKKDEEEEEEEVSGVYMKSKWELDTSEERLDKLDGLRVGKRKREPSPQRLEDYLQLPDDYDSRTSKPGQKRVRWADIEEKRHQLRRRELGFIVGQTDWERITDDTYADRLLNQTKYI